MSYVKYIIISGGLILSLWVFNEVIGTNRNGVTSKEARPSAFRSPSTKRSKVFFRFR
jgi:hypothetical protein